MLRQAIPDCRIASVTRLSGGYRNANFKVKLDSPHLTTVLRVYEHAPSLCQKEVDLIRLVGASVPVPEILFAAPTATPDMPAFAVFKFVEGITLRDLKQTGDKEAVAQAASSSGQILAELGKFHFSRAGWLSASLAVTASLMEGADPLPRFVDLCLNSANLQRRIRPEVRSRIHDLVWSWAARLFDLDQETSLVHCDFGMRNLLVRQERGTWKVAALLDWEFAVAGSPLIDLGHFLRYELSDLPLLEPHFSRSFRNSGGKLPHGWRQLSRIVDLSALLETFTRAQLPENVETEIAELIRFTAEDSDLHL